MIRQVEGRYNPSSVETEISAFWREKNAYEKTVEFRKGGEDYFFVDGPPYTTGHIHMGTALNKVIKDTVIRYLRMKNYNVRDQPGFDMHGLPIEVQVEKKLHVKTKREIEEIGIDKFVKECRSYALELQKNMSEEFASLGVWMDWNNPYLTIDEKFIEAAWWTVKKANDGGLLTRSKRVLQWCPRCETALAEAELEYWDEEDPSVYIRFRVRGTEDEYIVIWTTTPWTIPGNMAVAVHPNLIYVKVRATKDGGEKDVLYLLKETFKDVLKAGHYKSFKIIDEIQGEFLAEMAYIHPLEHIVPHQKEVEGKWTHKVILSDTVAAENTGCVHIAPGHGPEDFEMGAKYGLEAFCPVTTDGRYTDEVGQKYAGMNVKKANAVILEDLENTGVLLASGKISHRYGHCWRCKTPIIYRKTDQWFINVPKIKKKMLDEVERVQWHPEWAGSSREYDWVLNAREWCISRQRYWGIPMPVWVCDKCGSKRVVSTRKDLKNGENYSDDMDLHRPGIDRIIFKCEKCGGEMKRVPDVLDVWFDSGVSAWAQLGYPGSTEEFDRWWPTRWICEAHDQTRGWFYSQLAAGVISFDRAPYDSVLMHGWVLDSKGLPMSKSRGNTVKPLKVTEKYGVDSLRWYLLYAGAPWDDLSFQDEGVRAARKTIDILWNVYKFSSMYMALDSFNPDRYSFDDLEDSLKPEDRWMRSRTENLKKIVTHYFEVYELHKAVRAIGDFINEDLSRWYIKLIRDRMWKEGDDKDKIAAYMVVYDALLTVIRLSAPIIPYISEEIYQNLSGKFLSVHMADWPRGDATWISSELEEGMNIVREIVEVISKERQEKGVKLRKPLKRVVVRSKNEEILKAVETFKGPLLQQSNTKKLETVKPGMEWEEMELSVVPNPDAIGRVYRAWSSKIAAILRTRDARKVKEAIEKGSYKIGIEGQTLDVEPNMVSFSMRLPNDVVASEFSGGTLYIDFEVTDEIRAEGLSREIIRRIQQMRKEMKLDVEEYVRVEINAPEEVEELIKRWIPHIKKETRARQMEFKEEVDGEYIIEWDIEGNPVVIGVSSLHMKEAIASMMDIPGINRERAEMLFDSGYQRFEELKNASYEELAGNDRIGRALARRIRNYFEKEHLSENEQQCPVCGAIVSAEEKGCPRCGTPFVGEEEQAEPEIKETGDTEKELIDFLSRIPQISPAKAELLYKAGYTSVEKLKGITPEDISKINGFGNKLGSAVVSYVKSETGKQGPGVCRVCGAKLSPEDRVCPVCDTPVISNKDKQDEKVELQKSFTYLIEEERTNRAYTLLQDGIKQGMKAFCITRQYPAKIKSKYELGSLPILWLSNVGKENAIRPKDLEKMSMHIEQFLAGEGGIILLDGLEFLITNNKFLTVLRLIQSLRDQVAINQSILMLSVNPLTLEKHQLNLLEREVDVTLR